VKDQGDGSCPESDCVGRRAIRNAKISGDAHSPNGLFLFVKTITPVQIND